MRSSHLILVPLLIGGMISQGIAADTGRIVRSAIFPGIGQLGDGQTARGLLYLSGEAALLTFAIGSAAKSAAYSRNTKYDSVYTAEGGNSERLRAVYDDQKLSVEKSNTYRTRGYAFGAAAVVWWAWNIVDGVLLGPKKSAEDVQQESLLDRIRENTVVSVGPQKAEIVCRVDF